MPTVEKKYKPDPYRGRTAFEGNHDVFEMPEDQKPKGTFRPHINPRTILVILLLLLFIAAAVMLIVEILKRSQGFS